MTNQRLDRLTERELAEFYEQHKDDDSLWSETAVPMRRRRRGAGPSTSFAVRLAPEELMELKDAADEKGTTLSDFIREAALRRARSKGADEVVDPSGLSQSKTKKQLVDELDAAILDVVERFLSGAVGRSRTGLKPARANTSSISSLELAD